MERSNWSHLWDESTCQAHAYNRQDCYKAYYYIWNRILGNEKEEWDADEYDWKGIVAVDTRLRDHTPNNETTKAPTGQPITTPHLMQKRPRWYGHVRLWEVDIIAIWPEHFWTEVDQHNIHEHQLTRYQEEWRTSTFFTATTGECKFQANPPVWKSVQDVKMRRVEHSII